MSDQIKMEILDNLKKVYEKYPEGCSDEEMKYTLASMSRPNATYAYARGWDWTQLLDDDNKKIDEQKQDEENKIDDTNEDFAGGSETTEKSS